MVQHRLLPALLLASSLSGMGYAQTYTECNPLKATCPNNPGLQQKELTLDFTTTHALPPGWTTENQGQADYSGSNAKLIVAKPKDSLNIVSSFYMLFGSVEFRMRAAGGKGIVSTVVLISDDLDELDWEIVSKNPDQAESNYFGKGFEGKFDRGGVHAVPNNQNTFHTYRLDWTPQAITWSVDGRPVRTLKYEDANGGANFPQTPMRIKMGAWAPGDAANNKPGVVDWAGGPTDWNAAPFVMAVESVKIVNYSPAKEYIYTDRTGSYQSIKIVDGTLMSNGGSAPPPPAIEQPIVSTTTAVPVKPTLSSHATSLSSAVSSASRVWSSVTASSTHASNATATLVKPAVQTKNAAVGTRLALGGAVGAFALAALPLL